MVAPAVHRARCEHIGESMIQGHVADYFFRWLAPARAVRELGKAITILDIGCGDGDIAQRMSKLPNVEALTMVDVAQSVVRKAHRWYSLPGVVAWAEALPFHANSFDVALLIAVLEHVQDPAAAVAEAERVAQWVMAVVPALPDADPDHVRLFDLAGLAKEKGGRYLTDGKEAFAVWRSGACA